MRLNLAGRGGANYSTPAYYDRKKLMEWVGQVRAPREVKRLTVKEKTRTHIYERMSDMPLNENETVTVNYFEYWIREEGSIPIRGASLPPATLPRC